MRGPHSVDRSARRGARPDGNESKEIYGVTASLGEAFGAPQRLTFDDTGWAFTPTLAEDGSGGLHLAWWRLGLLPEGCTVDVDCTGTDNRISWTRGDTAGASGDITTGPGDWLPTLVHDASRERFLLVFAAVARDADGVVDLGEARTRLFAVTGAGNPPVWSSPVPLPALDDAAYHNTYPSLAVLPATTAGGVSSFVMAFTRYDAAQPGDPLHVIVEESTDTWVSTSEDGLGWQEPWRLSSGTDAIDVFPSVFVDFEGLPNVLWVSTTASAPAGETVATADLSTTVSPMPELAGYTSRVIATRTAGVLFGAWAIGAEPNYEVEGRFFQR